MARDSREKDEELLSLRQLLQEKERASQERIASLLVENQRIRSENERLLRETERRLAVYEGDDEEINRLASVEDCLALKLKLSQTVLKLEARKERLRKEEQEARNCRICLERGSEVVIIPCGHLCICSPCSARPSLAVCPICRGEVLQKMKVFS